MNDHINKVLLNIDMLTKLKKANALNPLTARALMSGHLKNDPSKYELLNQVIELSNSGKSPFELPESSETTPINLAISENNQKIGMYPQECHCLIAGQTGMGKTTLLNLIFSQALLQNSHIWLIVRAKDTRGLLGFKKNILVNSFDGSVKFNPLNPCGLSVYDYCNIFADIFIQSQSLYDGTKNYLIERLSFLYQRFEQYGTFPSMIDLFHYIQSLSHPRYTRAASYQDSALNRLGGMLSGPLGKVFDCSVGYENALINGNCIFEIENLTRQQQIFVVNILLTKLFRYKLGLNTDVWSLCGIDDGNLLFDVALERRPDQGMPIIHDLLSTVRKSKINVFCCTQTPHQIGASIHSNSAIKIMFSLANALDTEFMLRSIGNLTKEQREYCYGLENRQIVIKNTLRFQTPIVGMIPEVPNLMQVTDEEVFRNNSLILSTLPGAVPRYEPGGENRSQDETSRNTREESKKEKKAAGSKSKKDVTKTKEKPDSDAISDHEKMFLSAVNLFQYKKTLTEICLLAGFTAGTGSRIAKQCEKKNLVKMVQVKIGRGSPKYPVLLKAAYEILRIQERKFYGKGAGFEHILYQHLIAEHFSASLPEAKITIELHRGGKHIDVGIETNEKLIAIEVAMTAVHEMTNIEKDILKAKADIVITACKNDMVLTAVLEKVSKLSREMQSKVRVCLVAEVFKMALGEVLG
jgi:hypothetical protein